MGGANAVALSMTAPFRRLSQLLKNAETQHSKDLYFYADCDMLNNGLNRNIIFACWKGTDYEKAD